MQAQSRLLLGPGIAMILTMVLAAPGFAQQLQPDGSPQRAEDGGPPPITWPTPPLGDGPFKIESAEERHLRVVVITKGLEQPWSIAFLPDGSMLVTERPGRLRVVRNGVLDPAPVDGVPQVRSEGLQGLMDVLLHPRFEENHW